MSWDDWGWYSRSTRRPANGIKAQSKRFGQTWWAGKWLAALEELVDPGRLSRGRSYARSGQVLNIDVERGRVESRVQGSRPDPYDVSIEIKPLSNKQWDRVIDSMAHQAIFAAKLLAGEMPKEIEDAFQEAGVSLFPASEGDLQTECSCPDWANPCKHVSAVYYLLGEQFDADPFLIFRLRGKTKKELIKMLRARRGAAGEEAAEEAPRAEEEPAIPLADQLETFWTGGDSLEDWKFDIRPAEVDAVPVKRLGRPGFWRERQDLVELMSRAYRAIGEAGVELITGESE